MNNPQEDIGCCLINSEGVYLMFEAFRPRTLMPPRSFPDNNQYLLVDYSFCTTAYIDLFPKISKLLTYFCYVVQGTLHGELESPR